MAGDDWFRRTTWTEQDAADFEARLKRSRSRSRDSYLHLQAFHLAEAGEHRAALSLLDRRLVEYRDSIFTAESHLLRAECLDALGLVDEAVAAYRASLGAQEDRPNVVPGVERSFARFIAVRRIVDLYDEALHLALRGEWASGAATPSQRFGRALVQALIAHERGDAEAARWFAAVARVAAAETHSGYSRHPDVGLAGPIDPEIARRLDEIDAG
ncbi:MAG: hypothetical protein BGO49_06390 [Planctomycetales bacterium 71-10]|nr:MAG: hypothetical protein BGO49_06390 [Planctomycetales bacterium 71-10]